MTLSVCSPFAEVALIFDVICLPSWDTVRLVLPTALPALFKVNDAVCGLTCGARPASPAHAGQRAR
jgi:hypothetical protein